MSQTRQVLTADGQSLILSTVGQANVGIGLTGTWVGTVSFFYSQDGVNFRPMGVMPFPSGTAVLTATANGSFFAAVQDFQAIKVTFTRTSGSVTVVASAANDAAYQDAFLASTSQFVTSSHAAGAANVLTVAAQANRGWRLRTLTIGWSAAPSTGVLCTITDGASAVIWETYILNTIGDHLVNLPLPSDDDGGGVFNTPGNSLVITVGDPGGSVVSKINAEIRAT